MWRREASVGTGSARGVQAGRVLMAAAMDGGAGARGGLGGGVGGWSATQEGGGESSFVGGMEGESEREGDRKPYQHGPIVSV